MNHVFISYSVRDKNVMNRVCSALKTKGISTWVAERNIAGGAMFDEEIRQAIEQSTAGVVLISPSSVKSPHVRAEIELLVRRRKTVIPLIVRSAELPLLLTLQQSIKWNSDRP